jgi:hypothetical protein
MTRPQHNGGKISANFPKSGHAAQHVKLPNTFSAKSKQASGPKQQVSHAHYKHQQEFGPDFNHSIALSLSLRPGMEEWQFPLLLSLL